MTRRVERINHLLRETICELLQRQVKDPRLGGFVTVTEVTTSRDLRHAKVFVSVFGDEEESKKALEGLTAASGFLRRELGAKLSLRHIPELSFCRDNSINRGAHVLALIEHLSTEEEHQG